MATSIRRSSSLGLSAVASAVAAGLALAEELRESAEASRNAEGDSPPKAAPNSPERPRLHLRERDGRLWLCVSRAGIFPAEEIPGPSDGDLERHIAITATCGHALKPRSGAKSNRIYAIVSLGIPAIPDVADVRALACDDLKDQLFVIVTPEGGAGAGQQLLRVDGVRRGSASTRFRVTVQQAPKVNAESVAIAGGFAFVALQDASVSVIDVDRGSIVARLPGPPSATVLNTWAIQAIARGTGDVLVALLHNAQASVLVHHWPHR